MFIAKGIIRSCEKKVYQKGCIPDSGYLISWDVDLFAESKEDLLKKIKEYHNVDNECILIEGSKIYVQMVEMPLYDRWIDPEEKDIEKWKKGREELYLVDYSYKVFKEEPITV